MPGEISATRSATRRRRALPAVVRATPKLLHGDDPTLLDALPIVTLAPDRIKEIIYAAFDIHALYRKDLHQVTIRATITDTTPPPHQPRPASMPSHSWYRP